MGDMTLSQLINLITLGCGSYCSLDGSQSQPTMLKMTVMMVTMLMVMVMVMMMMTSR